MRTSWLIWGALGWAVACGDDGSSPAGASPDAATDEPSADGGGNGPESTSDTNGSGSPATGTSGDEDSETSGAHSGSQSSSEGSDGGAASTSDTTTSPETCSNECELDAIECDAEAGQDVVVRRCTEDKKTGCLRWRVVADCDGGACLSTLIDGGCNPSDAEARCSGEGLMICAPGATGCPTWQLPTEAMLTAGDVQIDEAASRFSGYGAFRIQLSAEVAPSQLTVCLTDTREGANASDAPVVDGIEAGGGGEYALTLSRYQLPVAYALQVAIGSPPAVRTTVLEPDLKARVAFISAARGKGDFRTWSGVTSEEPTAAADEVCTAEANAAGLGGSYRAFVSVRDRVDAICRLRGGDGLLGEDCGLSETPSPSQLSAPYLDMQGLPIAYGTSDIEAGLWRAPIRYTSSGAKVARTVPAWNGSEVNGVFADGDCTGWTSSDGAIRGSSAGSPGVSAPSGDYSSKCDGDKALLCFSADDGHPLVSHHERSGKAAFVVDVGINTVVDTEVADQACRSAAGSEDVIAWFSDESNDALCRLAGLGGKVTDNCGTDAPPVVEGPWVRGDGYLIGETSDDLLGGLLAPITLAWDGSFAAPNGLAELVRTDTQEYGGRGVVTAGTSCISGNRTTIGSGWTYVAGTCSGNVDVRMFVYCFER